MIHLLSFVHFPSAKNVVAEKLLKILVKQGFLRNPALSGDEPESSGKHPAESGCEPQLSGLKPEQSGNEPLLSGFEPDESGQRPLESGWQPELSGVCHLSAVLMP
jgi:hypothetical protein